MRFVAPAMILIVVVALVLVIVLTELGVIDPLPDDCDMFNVGTVPITICEE